MILLVDNDNKTNIIYWPSIKYKRIMRSVLVFELSAMVYRFDVKSMLKSTMKCVLEQSVLIILYINLKSLYNCFVKLGTTWEKRLIINIICL